MAGVELTEHEKQYLLALNQKLGWDRPEGRNGLPAEIGDPEGLRAIQSAESGLERIVRIKRLAERIRNAAYVVASRHQLLMDPFSTDSLAYALSSQSRLGGFLEIALASGQTIEEIIQAGKRRRFHGDIDRLRARFTDVDLVLGLEIDSVGRPTSGSPIDRAAMAHKINLEIAARAGLIGPGPYKLWQNKITRAVGNMSVPMFTISDQSFLASFLLNDPQPSSKLGPFASGFLVFEGKAQKSLQKPS